MTDVAFEAEQSSPLSTPIQRLDSTTGLHYYKARYYDSYSATFTKPDTIVDGARRAIGYNRYAYVHNRPTVLVDPTGNCGEYDPRKPDPHQMMVTPDPRAPLDPDNPFDV